MWPKEQTLPWGSGERLNEGCVSCTKGSRNRDDNSPRLLVNNVAVGTTHTCRLLVDAVMKLKSAMDGLKLFSKAGWSG